jgi:phage portal protein BeeE
LKVLDFESLNRKWRDRPDHQRRNMEKVNELQLPMKQEQFKGLPDSGSTVDPTEHRTSKINRLCDLDIKSIVSFEDS